jgi:hypothetical protein
MPILRTTPEERAKRQLSALSAATRGTIKALAKDPAPQQAAKILDRYDERIEQIVRPRRKRLPLAPPSEFCWTCGKRHPRPVVTEWELPGAWQCPWAVGVTAVFLLLFAFFEWWALWVFPAAWLVSFSFFWSITIPVVLLIGVIIVLGATGIRF